MQGLGNTPSINNDIHKFESLYMETKGIEQIASKLSWNQLVNNHCAPTFNSHITQQPLSL